MRNRVRVERLSEGVRVAAADWPGAAWCAGVLLVPGVPLLLWAALGARPIEAGGALVFVALGTLAAWLALAKRRDLVVERGAEGVRVRGTEGAGPFRRPVDVRLPVGTQTRVVPFPVPAGGPDLADRGGDLVLAGPGASILLARRTGPGWRDELDAAARSLNA